MAEGRTKWPPVEDDWFVEPPEVTTWILARERFDGRVYDPCCGQGNIVEACLAHGLDASGSDLRKRTDRPWLDGCGDFRHLRLGGTSIISNPPYGRAKLAEHFIRHFWTGQMLPIPKLAVFVNAKFMFGAGRGRGLFADMPPSRVWPVNPRPSCPPGRFLAEGGKAEGGVENFVWMIWDRSAAPGTMVHWSPVDSPGKSAECGTVA